MLAQARQTPWKAINELRRYAELPLIRAYFALHGIAWGHGWLIYGRPLIQRHAGSTITIGRGLEHAQLVRLEPARRQPPLDFGDVDGGRGDHTRRHVGMTGATIVAQAARQHRGSRLCRRQQHHLRHRLSPAARRSASG